jgi:glycosyltransferase involved in cell wall biosynthesis
MLDSKTESKDSGSLFEYKLSVVTVNLNNAEGLARTIGSVVNQTFSDIQFIVIDGASSDNSVEIIKEYAKDIDFYISEKDSGVYSAMNKGIVQAKGEYLIFMNSGDSFIDSDIVRRVFDENASADLIYGYIETPVGIRVIPEKLDVSFLVRRSLNHQATFIKRKLFDKIGLYNEINRFESDWEFFILALLKEKCSVYNFKHVVSFFEMGGLSANPKLDEIKYKEKKEVIRRVLPELSDWYSDYTDLILEKRALDARSHGFFYRIAEKLTNSKITGFLRKMKS